jgi:transcriptional antiterminator RfaH
MMHEDRSWNILRIAPNREYSIIRHLVDRGLECYLPTYKIRRGSGRMAKITDKPLFPGYMFIRMGQDGAEKAIHSFSGCLGYLIGLEGPKSLSEAAIALVRQVEEDMQTSFYAKAARRGWAFRPGDKVTVCRKYHPFDGIEAILQGVDKRDRAILLLMVPGRALTVSVSAQWLREAASSLASPREASATTKISHAHL